MKGERKLMSYTYDELLTGWEYNVDLFFAWLTDVCGIKRDHYTYKELKKYITSVDDIKEWIKFFDGDIDNIIYTSEEFIKWKAQRKSA